MADKTGIQWTDATWNPIVGCSPVSAGCDHCYASDLVGTRLRGLPVYTGLTLPKRGGRHHAFTGEVRYVEERLAQPLRWARPRRIFVNSMSDLFHPGLDRQVVVDVFAVMALTARHQYQVLTKRPQLMARMLAAPEFQADVAEAAQRLAGPKRGQRLSLDNVWPLPNVWLGTSIETDQYAWRADHLRATPAVLRFVSAEPLLGPLPSLDLAGIDWLIIGGESGPDARLISPSWVTELLAMAYRAETAPFVKQMGSAFAALTDLHDKKGGDPNEWPPHLRVRRWPTVGER